MASPLPPWPLPRWVLPLSRPGGAPSVAADLADTDTVFPGMEAAQDEAEHIGTVITPAARDALLPDELKTKKIHKLNMVTRQSKHGYENNGSRY